MGFLIVVRLCVRAFLGDNADNPVPTNTLWLLGALFAPLMIVAIFGLRWMVQSHKRQVEALEISPREDHAWPQPRPALLPTAPPPDGPSIEAYGFSQVGSLDVAVEDHTAIFAVLLSTDGSTIVINTPLHMVLVSDFAGKLLTTSNGAVDVAMKHALGQGLAGADFTQLLTGHRQACSTVADVGGTATVFSAADALRAVVKFERYAVQQARSTSPLRTILLSLMFPWIQDQPKVLRDDKPSRARIEHWLSRPERWTAATA